MSGLFTTLYSELLDCTGDRSESNNTNNNILCTMYKFFLNYLHFVYPNNNSEILIPFLNDGFSIIISKSSICNQIADGCKAVRTPSKLLKE